MLSPWRCYAGMPLRRGSVSRLQSGSSAMRPIAPSRMAAAMSASAMMLAASISASADEIRVTSSNALKPVLEQVAPEFENATGHRLVFTWGQAEILKGTSFDLAAAYGRRHRPADRARPARWRTRTAVAVSAAGLAVRKGAAKPDISTVEAFKRTLLDAEFDCVRRAGRHRGLPDGAVCAAWHCRRDEG